MLYTYDCTDCGTHVATNDPNKCPTICTKCGGLMRHRNSGMEAIKPSACAEELQKLYESFQKARKEIITENDVREQKKESWTQIFSCMQCGKEFTAGEYGTLESAKTGIPSDRLYYHNCFKSSTKNEYGCVVCVGYRRTREPNRA